MVKLFKQGGQGILGHGLPSLRAKSLTGCAMCQPVVDDLSHLEGLPSGDCSVNFLVLMLILVPPHLSCYLLSMAGGGRGQQEIGASRRRGQQGQR